MSEWWHPDTACPQAGIDDVYHPIEVQQPDVDYLAADVRCPRCGCRYTTVIAARFGSPDPDYVVIRAAPDLPAGFLPPDLDGRWFDRADMPLRYGVGDAVAVASGRFEVRDDGAVAEVFEVRP